MIIKPFSEKVSDIKEPTQETLKPFIEEAHGGTEIRELDVMEVSSREKESLFVRSIGFLGSFSGLFSAVAGFVFVILLGDAIETIESLFRGGSLLDSLYLVALITLLLSLAIMSYRNYTEMRSLKSAKKMQEFFAQEREQASKNILPVVLTLLAGYTKSTNSKLQEKALLLRNRIESSHEYKEIYRELDEEVLSEIDRVAQKKIKTASVEAAISTALSPLALLDVALIIWRSVRLSREIAELYGYKPNWLFSVILLKQAAFNLFFAGASELALEYTNDIAQASLLSKLSTSAAQGMGNGILLARVGYGIMQACRPLPMRVKRESFTKGIYSSIKESILSKK